MLKALGFMKGSKMLTKLLIEYYQYCILNGRPQCSKNQWKQVFSLSVAFYIAVEE